MAHHFPSAPSERAGSLPPEFREHAFDAGLGHPADTGTPNHSFDAVDGEPVAAHTRARWVLAPKPWGALALGVAGVIVAVVLVLTAARDGLHVQSRADITELGAENGSGDELTAPLADSPEHSPPPVAAVAPEEGFSSSDGTSNATEAVMVHVAGAVHEPGVVRVSIGSRVIDAVTAAGGPRDDAQLHDINLAAPVADGAQIFVPAPGLTVPAATSAPQLGPGAPPRADSTRVDINTADAAELDTLPGVGPVTAGNIVAYRDTHGRFGSAADLIHVPGIGAVTAERLAAHVSCSP